MIHYFNKLMGRKLLILLVLLSLIFWNNSGVFGYDKCIYENNFGIEVDYTHEYGDHICGKLGSNSCYFPISDNTLAFHYRTKGPMHPTDYLKISDEKFHKIFGGCSLYVSYPQNKIRANFVRGSVENFMAACEAENLFSTKMDFTYGAYDKGNLIDIDDGVTKITLTGQYVRYKEGYPLSEKIRIFKNEVINDIDGDVYDREIYTLRVIEAEITDNKCLEPKHILRDKPISVATKLLLKPKLNDNDNIVYDDKETKKIEVNADQDEFYFGGTLITIEKEGLGAGRITI